MEQTLATRVLREMAMLYGTAHTARSLAERAGAFSQFAGVRLSTLGDGAGRGIRVLDFDTGSGLRFTVNVDRALDIGAASHNGRAIGWHGPAGARHPALAAQGDDNDLGWNRSFSGFLATCGLDHILGPEDVPAETYSYPRQTSIHHGLHGRIANTPARLTGYGETWDGEDCRLWAEGVVVQATLFGEVLHLRRRIEADLGGNTIRLSDQVVNAGFSCTPHMLLYHVNLGYPVIDLGSRYLAPIEEVLFASHAVNDLDAQGVGYRNCPAPVAGFSEQVWQHAMVADAEGMVPVAVLNDQLALGLMMETSATTLPCAYQWQNFRAGHYVMGIEAATHHIKGNLFARSRDEMIWLDAGDSRDYHARFTVLDGAAEITAAEARIRAIAGQPETDYPMPSNRFPPLHGSDAG